MEGVCKARVRTSLICMHVCVCVVKAPCPNTAPLAKLWPRAARHAAFPLFLVRERSLLFITGWLLSWANRDAQRVQRTSSHLNADLCLCFCPSFSLQMSSWLTFVSQTTHIYCVYLIIMSPLLIKATWCLHQVKYSNCWQISNGWLYGPFGPHVTHNPINHPWKITDNIKTEHFFMLHLRFV